MNVLLVLADQLGAAWSGESYGNPVVQTPHLDALAREGATFERCYTPSPLCTPARAALLTGRHPRQTGITALGQPVAPETTLADLFHQAGWRTACVGKWHLAGPPHANRRVLPHERGGFADFTGWESHHVDHWRGSIWSGESDTPIVMAGHETDALTDLACAKLAELRSDPFFLFVSYQAPHPPCSPPEEFEQIYRERGDLFSRPSMDPAAWFRKPQWQADYGAQTFLERYFGEITHLDAALGRLLTQLDDCGLADDTLVVFSSDHGEMASCHGLFGKQVMFEEAIQAPLVIRGPGVAPARSGALVSLIDLLPTLLDCCGLPLHPPAAGSSFAPILRGARDVGARDFIVSQESDLCLRTADRKLVTDVEGSEMRAFYDLRDDPDEMVNALASRTDDARELHDLLQDWLAQHPHEPAAR